jgi:DNA-binding NtrC family response regulator
VLNVGRGATVLVVDPDELLRWSLVQSLTEHGYRVRLAVDSREALDGEDAAVALVDHDLPGTDGFGTAAALNRCSPSCVVVLMSPDPSPLLYRQAAERGIDTILEKPFSLEDLFGAVRRAARQARDRSRPPEAAPRRSGEGRVAHAGASDG